jgi:hypothetical protein
MPLESLSGGANELPSSRDSPCRPSKAKNHFVEIGNRFVVLAYLGLMAAVLPFGPFVFDRWLGELRNMQ